MAISNFSKLVDMEKLQNLQDNFANATGIYALVADPNGKPITKPSNHTDFCYNYIRQSNSGRRLCEKCDKEALKEVFAGMEFKITEISDPVLIQNTKGLYKISAKVDMTYEGETESAEYDFYVNKVKVNAFKSEYKLVGGDVPGTVLYMMFLTEYYNDLYSEMGTDTEVVQ
jgi:hypothetical protein